MAKRPRIYELTLNGFNSKYLHVYNRLRLGRVEQASEASQGLESIEEFLERPSILNLDVAQLGSIGLGRVVRYISADPYEQVDQTLRSGGDHLVLIPHADDNLAVPQTFPDQERRIL